MPGKLVHFEIPSKDTAQSKAFWSGLFDWEFGDSGMPGMEYYMVRTGEDQGGAVMSSDDAGSGVTIYFDTDDIDASIAKVRKLGGNAEDKMPIPQIGWFTSCSDIDGNAFSLFQSDESATG
jgi:uncharacterized protein